MLVVSTQYQQLILTWPLSFQGEYGTITLQDLNIQIHEEPRIRSKNAPSVHRLCWVVLVNRPSNHQLCDLGIAMTPLVWTGLPQNIYQDHLTLFKAIHKLQNFKNNNKKTTLYELLERSQNLPTELIAIIWDFIAPCTIRCLLSLSATENTWPDCSSGARSGTISLHGNIAVYRTCVLGGTYICGIRQGNNIYGHESSVSLNVPVPSFATAFVFRIGIYGLRSIDFVTDTKTNPFSKGDITVKDNEFISIIHHQHEVDLDWDVWCPQPLSDECSKLMQSNTEPENRTHQLPRQTAFWTWLSMDKSITTGSPIPSLCRLILSLAAPLWFCQTFPEIHGIYSTAGGWIQAVWSHCILLWKGTCWPGYSFLLLTILLAQVILVWWAKGLLCSCPIWRFRGCEPTYSLLAPEWPSGKALSHCMFNTAYPEITEL